MNDRMKQVEFFSNMKIQESDSNLDIESQYRINKINSMLEDIPNICTIVIPSIRSKLQKKERRNIIKDRIKKHQIDLNNVQFNHINKSTKRTFTRILSSYVNLHGKPIYCDNKLISMKNIQDTETFITQDNADPREIQGLKSVGFKIFDTENIKENASSKITEKESSSIINTNLLEQVRHLPTHSDKNILISRFLKLNTLDHGSNKKVTNDNNKKSKTINLKNAINGDHKRKLSHASINLEKFNLPDINSSPNIPNDHPKGKGLRNIVSLPNINTRKLNPKNKAIISKMNDIYFELDSNFKRNLSIAENDIDRRYLKKYHKKSSSSIGESTKMLVVNKNTGSQYSMNIPEYLDFKPSKVFDVMKRFKVFKDKYFKTNPDYFPTEDYIDDRYDFVNYGKSVDYGAEAIINSMIEKQNRYDDE